MSKHMLVTKSNNLIEARYKLTVEEQRLILFLVSMIQPTDEDFKSYTIKVKDFMQLVDVKNKGIYKQFITISESLSGKTVTIKKENSTLVTSWLSSAEYFDNQGKIEISFDPKLKPYLLKLKNNFTTYKLENIIKLKSFYSIRIYELLKQYEKLQERVFTIEQLRNCLCIDNNQYPLYGNFKQKVLNVAKKELKEKTDIYFDIEEIKKERKIEKIKFIIYKNVIEDILLVVPRVEEDITQNRSDRDKAISELTIVIKENITQNDLLSILDAAAGDVELIKSRYNVARTKRQLDNFVGFMVWACGQPDEVFMQIESRGKNKFNNFVGHKRDYDELERLELEYLDSLILPNNS